MEEGQIMGTLYCLAELGAASDLSDVSGLDTGIIAHFESATEGVTNAASYALGRSALGNLPAFLPALLDHVDDKDSLKYLTLLSVKEVVAGDSAKALSDEDLAAILECLVKQCGTEEEAARNVVSECLGRILATHPLEHIQMTRFGSICASPITPRARRILTAQPLDHIQVTIEGSI